MTDEIKEILDNVKKCCDITKDQSITVYQRQDILALLDYITNLQEENEKLKEEQEYNNYCDEQLRKKISNLEYKITTLEDYKSRIDKAVEYINANQDYFNNYPLINRSELLNILKGDK